jgi:hypothetical protein
MPFDARSKTEGSKVTDWRGLAASGDYSRIAQALLGDAGELDLPLLQEDPWAAIAEMPDLIISTQDALPNGSCGGGYYDRKTRTIYLHPSGRRRNNFTLLHELGHHHQQNHPEWGFVLMDDIHPLQRRKVEESVSDQFAAEVLLRSLPTTDSDQAVQSPALVMACLFSDSAASRSAVLKHVAGTLRNREKWILAVADLNGKVVQAEVTYEQYPPKRGMVQPGFARLATEAADGLLHRRVFSEGMVYQRGGELHDMKVEAVLDEEATHVFVALTPVHRFGMGKIEAAWYLCGNDGCAVDEHCAETDSEWCRQCDEPKCPGCNGCNCGSTIRSTQCSECRVTITPYEKENELHECW